MPLEDAIERNTEALNRLISVLAGLPVVVPGAPVPADTVKAGTKSTEKPDEAASLSYDEDVRKPFLALLSSNRPGAMKVLADLGVANLKGFEGQPETYADLVRRIKEAQNG